MSQILFLSSDPVLKQKSIELLSQSGLDTSSVATCLDGLLIIDKNGIEVAIIDEELADMSGYEACLRVRQHSDIPIVLLGSVTESEVRAKVEELGFDIYLRKPISPRKLMARIRALLKRPATEKKESIIVGEKPVEIKSSITYPGITRPEAAKPSEVLKNKVEPAIFKVEPEPPVQVVPPVAANVPGMQVVPPQPPREQVVLSPEREQTAVPQVNQEARIGELTGETALEDVRTLKLVDALVNGKLTEITPVIDLSMKLGYGYPTVDGLIDSSDQETVNTLENLAKNGILIRSPFEKLYTDPEGLMQLFPIECCPRCDSGNLVKGQLVEHFNCGYVGLVNTSAAVFN
jgi:CheY-like chemotaxis protein